MITILSVDDSPVEQRLMAMAIRSADSSAELHCVADGESALAYLRGEQSSTGVRRPDLLVLDLSLPTLDGREIAAEVRADPSLKHIPLVLLSGAEASAELSEFCKVHSVPYLTKPFGIDRYFSTMKALVEYARAMAEKPECGAEHELQLTRSAAAG